VNNVCVNSLNQLYDLKKYIDSQISVINICDEENDISGSHLNVDYAFKQAISLLSHRKKKELNELTQPLYMKLSVDGTILNNKFKYVAYTLCAYECHDTEYANQSNHVLLALISCDESHEVLKHYFNEMHKELEQKICLKSIICDNISIKYKFIICSDMKSLFTFMGLSGVCSKFNCIYCATRLTTFCRSQNRTKKYKGPPFDIF
jgi:hypothetical protein